MTIKKFLFYLPYFDLASQTIKDAMHLTVVYAAVKLVNESYTFIS